ncbi:hypothetical protein N9D67_03585 [Gammaproteobacteria bacterium]|nr:hypothetical protein [Gammaproteobacteria bacterium]
MSSFDGLNITSGYHLAWAFFLSIIAKISSLISDSKYFFLFNAFFVSSLLIAITAHRNFKDPVHKICFFLIIFSTFSLTEVALLTMLCLLVLSHALSNKSLDNKLILFCMFLIPLVRIDAAFFCCSVALLSFYFQSPKTALKITLAFTLGLATQFALMQLIFDSFFSVSSIIKASSSSIQNFQSNIVYNLGNSKAMILRSSSYLILNLILISVLLKNGLNRFEAFVIILLPNSLFLHHFLISGMRSWYWATPLALSFFSAVWLSKEGYLNRYVVNIFSILFILPALTGFVYSAVKYAPDQQYSKQFVMDLNHYASKHGFIIYQIDGSGFTGFFSEQPLINGDGLTNSYDYLNKKNDHDLKYFLRNNKICLIITNMRQTGQYVVNYYGLEVLPQDTEIVISPPDNLNSNYSNFALHKLNNLNCAN